MPYSTMEFQMTFSDFANLKRLGASSGFSATAELLVNTEFHMAVRRDQSDGGRYR